MPSELHLVYMVSINRSAFELYKTYYSHRHELQLHGTHKFHPIVKYKHYQISSGARASLLLLQQISEQMESSKGPCSSGTYIGIFQK